MTNHIYNEQTSLANIVSLYSFINQTVYTRGNENENVIESVMFSLVIILYSAVVLRLKTRLKFVQRDRPAVTIIVITTYYVFLPAKTSAYNRGLHGLPGALPEFNYCLFNIGGESVKHFRRER